MRLAPMLVIAIGLASIQATDAGYVAASEPPGPLLSAASLPDEAGRNSLPGPAPPPPGGLEEGGLQVSSRQPSGTGITLAQLEELAERCNPTLLQARAQVQAARGRYLQAGIYPNPVVGYQAGEIGNEGRAGQQGGFIRQEIVTAGKLRLNCAIATHEIRQAEDAWQAQRLRVLTDVRRGFYEVLAAQRTLELTQELVRIAEEGVKATEQLFEAKEAARTDLLQARIEAESAKMLLQTVQNRYVASWRSLAAVVGAPEMQPTPLIGNLEDGIPQFTWEETFERLLATSPQLAAAQAGVARAQAALSRECAERIPNVELQVGVQQDNVTGDTIAGVQLAVPIPIYDRNQGNIRRAQAELSLAQHEVDRVRLALQQRLAAVFEQYLTARQQIDTYTREILPNAQESLKLVSAGYRQGELSYLELLTAQRTYLQANLAYLEALRQLRAAAATIEGNMLTDSLQGAEPAVAAPSQR